MRKQRAKKRYLAPDPIYNDTVVTRFVNTIMLDGKKSIAYTVFYEAMDKIKASTGEEGYDIWKKAMDNVMPAIEVRSRRIGGATFQIPTPIREDRKMFLMMKWLVNFARKRNGKSMGDKLAAELIAASKGEGSSVKRKEDMHKMAEANKAFSHFKV
ncbi:MAG TPA: 30S ribosomal protein S7 [Chitinophagales bacterium]|nr:30S ribosomal protein S7 [Chitinophagales bacterium]MCB0511468.1 30S ribosomal protein S7 [Bacteroidota bacterium]MCB9075691.1 30S ribosomal protein S7 [Chitinophagales bacterium]HMU98105.1 30S ribosomal protein S7 [Chitinophagales bacterium]HMV03274.1 30S ribosomal protein S7 [Chitinophagales bacterium]